jgi:hypothetical protein
MKFSLSAKGIPLQESLLSCFFVAFVVVFPNPG